MIRESSCKGDGAPIFWNERSHLLRNKWGFWKCNTGSFVCEVGKYLHFVRFKLIKSGELSAFGWPTLSEWWSHHCRHVWYDFELTLDDQHWMIIQCQQLPTHTRLYIFIWLIHFSLPIYLYTHLCLPRESISDYSKGPDHITYNKMH